MSHLVSNIKKYLFDKGKTYSEIEDIFNYDEVVVQDIGDGAYLAEWKIEDVDKPLDADLMDNDNFEEILKVRNMRGAEYPSVVDQLDMIYHDIDVWREKIKSIKEKYPLPLS